MTMFVYFLHLYVQPGFAIASQIPRTIALRVEARIDRSCSFLNLPSEFGFTLY